MFSVKAGFDYLPTQAEVETTHVHPGRCCLEAPLPGNVPNQIFSLTKEIDLERTFRAQPYMETISLKNR